MGLPEKFSNTIKEYIKTRYENQKNITHLASEIKGKFGLDDDVEQLRRAVSNVLKRAELTKKKSEIKRLFFDIETSYYVVPTFQFWKVNINTDNILRDKKIICICYKWQYEDEVHTLVWDSKQDDSKLIKDFIQVIKHADEIVAHNGDKFDMKELRTRALLTGNLMFPVSNIRHA